MQIQLVSFMSLVKF